MAEKKAARHRCNDDRAKAAALGRSSTIIAYERGALIAGLLTAASVGACMLHWAVM